MKLKLNVDRIKEHCTRSIADYVGLAGFQQHTLSDGSFYLFQDNGADILMVAHLDVVSLPVTFRHKRGKVTSVALDDRLGVYILLEVLPALGIVCDVLLTVDEEDGDSTARGFQPTKEYKWVGEFDRKGTDVVVYDYMDNAWLDALESVGYRIGLGCYSDISELEFMGVACANFGCGYKKIHTIKCRANLRTVQRAIGRFAKFYAQYKDTRFVCGVAYRQREETVGYTRGDGAWGDTRESNQGCQCDGCGLWCSLDDMVYDHNYNAYCGDCAYVLEHSYMDETPPDRKGWVPWGELNYGWLTDKGAVV